MTDKEFFLQETLLAARQMNLGDARRYLGGMLAMIGHCDEADKIRSAFILLDESDRQLELIGKPSTTTR